MQNSFIPAVRPYLDAFTGTAKNYAKYRPGYPPAMYKLLADEFGLDGSGRYLDLACGTGKLTFPLARYFSEVLAIDPEQEMLDEAAKLARRKYLRNISFLCASSYDLPQLSPTLGMFKFATIGTAFHWMDRAKTLQQLHGFIHPDGAMAIITMREYQWSDSLWHIVILPLIQKWLGEKQRAGSNIYQYSGKQHIEFVKASPFSKYDQRYFMQEHKYTIDQVVGYLASTSYCSPHVLGDKWAGFEQELRSILGNFSANQLRITSVIEVLLMWS